MRRSRGRSTSRLGCRDLDRTINSAVIAGNPPKRRVDALRAFWHAVSTSPLGIPYFRQVEYDEVQHRLVNQARAMGVMLFGAPNFFGPRMPPAAIWPPGSPDKASYYDNTPLRATLEQLVDFDRINAGDMRFSVGAVDIRTGNFAYFDSKTHRITFEHIAASGSWPPGFPATKVGVSYFWDGGLISNTPLEWVLDAQPRRDTLAFQVDLWNARGELPKDMTDVEVRHKEIIYSSRSRAARSLQIYTEAAHSAGEAVQTNPQGIAGR